MKKTFLASNLLLVVLVILSCQVKQEVSLFSEPIIGECDDYVVSGQYVTESYWLDCLSRPMTLNYVPRQVFYSFKEGNWKYWNHEGQLIAEGVYTPVKFEENKYLPSGYELRGGRIDTNTWKFWNKDGERIKPNLALIMHIEACIVD